MTDFMDFFSKNAEWYSRSTSHRSGKDLEFLLENMNILGESVALDLATGTGFTAFEIARRARKVFAFDGNDRMLEEARAMAQKLGLKNIEFMRGDVETLQFKENMFDIVTCRRAAHHFKNKGRFLSEASRVMKMGGRFGLVDFVRPENDNADVLNRIEIIRDPSHVGAIKASIWKKLAEENGFTISNSVMIERMISFTEWLEPVSDDSKEASEIRNLLLSENRDDLENAYFNIEEMKLKKDYLIMICTKTEDCTYKGKGIN